MSSKSTDIDYKTISQRLDEVLVALQSPDISIDEAIALHKEGNELIAQLDTYLKKAEITITKLKAS